MVHPDPVQATGLLTKSKESLFDTVKILLELGLYSDAIETVRYIETTLVKAIQALDTDPLEVKYGMTKEERILAVRDPHFYNGEYINGSGGRILAIKDLRARTNKPLKESKEIVDNFLTNRLADEV